VNYLYEEVSGAGTAQPSTVSVLPATPHLKITLAQADISLAPGARTQPT
jgi:hypothetical protein